MQTKNYFKSLSALISSAGIHFDESNAVSVVGGDLNAIIYARCISAAKSTLLTAITAVWTI